MVDARQFNIRDDAGHLFCPACGFPDFSDEAAYSRHGGLAGTAICPCCLWEPGFDDDRHASATAEKSILASLRAYRSAWIDGPHWKGHAAEKPSGWDGKCQLARLFEIAPNVR